MPDRSARSPLRDERSALLGQPDAQELEGRRLVGTSVTQDDARPGHQRAELPEKRLVNLALPVGKDTDPRAVEQDVPVL